MSLLVAVASSGGMAPGAPTIGTATAGDASASVAFTVPAYKGKGTGTVTYTATSSPGSVTGTATSSPITVSGLTNGTAYTFTVKATTSYGVTGPSSAASNSITPVSPSSYESISSTVLTSTTNDITFSSLPTGTYQSFEIRFKVRGVGASMALRFNGVSDPVYGFMDLRRSGSAALASQTSAFVASIATDSSYPANWSVGRILIVSPANTNFNQSFKAYSGFANNGGGSAHITGGMADSTSAITSITILNNSTGFVQGSQISLYGIKA